MFFLKPSKVACIGEYNPNVIFSLTKTGNFLIWMPFSIKQKYNEY